ncbi:putative RNA exonuclease rex2 [Zalerion maritima]|uniref:RNA exonuclease rex2 n=1 Tax=Zalerion maritima TaxID=339359 RepID=A0AAD5RJK7_9PEZI|nr:putative RNA exonuclease rex2 [Zalerion maritima]
MGRRYKESLDDPLIWIDLEMTGLDPDRDQIIEVYCLITDGQLNLLDPVGFGTVVSCPQSLLDGMDDWCTNTHGASGLTAKAKTSEVSAKEASEKLLEYIQKYVPKERMGLLAGNSVHVDRMFLAKEPWKEVYKYVHYRIFDVSVLGEAVKRWSNDEVKREEPRKKRSHTAKEDILESLQQARYYRRVVFGRNDDDGRGDGSSE